MTEMISNSERYKRERAQLVEDRCVEIIGAAAEPFLEKGWNRPKLFRARKIAWIINKRLQGIKKTHQKGI